MLGIDSGFFLLIPDGSKRRILHPAKVVGLKDNLYTARLEEEDLAVVDGQDVLIYYENGREFLQQAAHIHRVIEDEPKPFIEFEMTGEPVSAENRQYYRVCAVMTGLTAELGNEKDCPLVDVSYSGFSVIAGEDYAIGRIMDAAVSCEGKEFRGKVCVQSIRVLSEGRIRCGLHCVENASTAGSLPKGLHHLCLSLQREQLRRLAATP